MFQKWEDEQSEKQNTTYLAQRIKCHKNLLSPPMGPVLALTLLRESLRHTAPILSILCMWSWSHRTFLVCAGLTLDPLSPLAYISSLLQRPQLSPAPQPLFWKSSTSWSRCGFLPRGPHRVENGYLQWDLPLPRLSHSLPPLPPGSLRPCLPCVSPHCFTTNILNPSIFLVCLFSHFLTWI